MKFRSRRPCIRSYATILPYLLVALYYIRSHSNSVVVIVSAYTYNSYPFLYVDDKQQATNATYPIHEHLPIKVNDNDDRPDFIYNPKPGEYRVIEYYVHWCNICRHFNKHYIKFARQIQQLLKEKNSDVTITFHAISCVPNKMLCRKQNVPGYPMVQFLKPGETFGTIVKHSDVKPVAMLQALGINVDGMKELDDNDANDDMETNVINPSIGQVITVHRTRDDLRNDIHLSFDFAMRNNVYTRDTPLTEEEKRALKEYLYLMQRTLPASWNNLHALLESLTRNYRYVSKKEPYLIKLLDKHPPQNYNANGDAEWSSSCSKGEPGRGFTCGLWEAFHAISVGVVNYNFNQVDDNDLIAPESAARMIRDFVQYFLHCTECTEHFIQMYDTCAYKRCQRLTKVTKLSGDKTSELEWRALPLWLYEVHNGVNVRLRKEKAQREKQSAITVQDIIDVQWPPVNECPICWFKPDRKGKRLWNETAVFNFLQLEYGKRDDTVLNFHKDLLAIKSDPRWKPNSQQLLRVRTGPSSSGPSNVIMTSTFMHPIIMIVCAIGYVSMSGTGRTFWRRIFSFGRRKLRTQ